MKKLLIFAFGCVFGLMLILFVSSIFAEEPNCQLIQDEREPFSEYIGSAYVERVNVGQTYTPPRYWRSKLGLWLDLKKEIALGSGPAPLNNTKFYSDDFHQWHLCKKQNGYYYAILEPIMGFGD